jgi:hypothetical protein
MNPKEEREKLKTDLGKEEKLFKEAQVATQRFESYNPLNPSHQAHFEAMYARFTGSGISVAQTVNHARNGVAAAVNPRQP